MDLLLPGMIFVLAFQMKNWLFVELKNRGRIRSSDFAKKEDFILQIFLFSAKIVLDNSYVRI